MSYRLRSPQFFTSIYSQNYKDSYKHYRIPDRLRLTVSLPFAQCSHPLLSGKLESLRHLFCLSVRIAEFPSPPPALYLSWRSQVFCTLIECPLHFLREGKENVASLPARIRLPPLHSRLRSQKLPAVGLVTQI